MVINKTTRLIAGILLCVFLFVGIITLITPYVYAVGAPVEVTIDDNGVKINVSTSAGNVKELLGQQHILLAKEDAVAPALNEKLQSGSVVSIQRAKDVTIKTMYDELHTKTLAAVDLEFVKSLGFTVGKQDYVNVDYDDGKNVVASLIKVEEAEVQEEIVLEHGTNEVYTDEMIRGTSETVQSGSDGVAVQTYTVRYENGEEVSKVLTDETVTQRPVDTVIRVGTAIPKKPVTETVSASGGKTITTSGGKVLPYYKSIDMTATAYDLSYESCGKRPGDRGYGITASGMQARVGVVAVDPSVIPLGTKLYIAYPDGSWAYGESVAGDTGGGIRGNRIDLFFNTRSECIQFGRRTVRVYFLSE